MEKGHKGEAEFAAGGSKAASDGQGGVIRVAPNETETVLRRDVAWASMVQVRLRRGPGRRSHTLFTHVVHTLCSHT